MATTQKIWAWSEIWTKFKSENDVEEADDFVDETEMREKANEAINRAESQIHSLNEDYFLTRDTITLVSGTEEYDLPIDIYANKIRGMRYFNTSTKRTYNIRRIADHKKFMEYRLAKFNTTGTEQYSYFLVNGTPGSPQVMFSPPPYESGALVEVWYIRNANRLEEEDDVCDIPEFIQYVFDYMTEYFEFKCGARSPKHITALEALAKTEVDMLGTLANMVPDGDNLIPGDFSVYEEHS